MESSILLTNICCRDYSSFVLFRIYSYFGNFPQDLFWKISTNCVPCVLGGVCPRSKLQRWGKILAGPIRVFHSPSLEWFKDEDVAVFVFFICDPRKHQKGSGDLRQKGGGSPYRVCYQCSYRGGVRGDDLSQRILLWHSV